MKKYAWLVSVVFFLAFVPMLPSQLPVFAGGDGSSGNPYQITNCFELQAMNNDVNASYVLMNDIDCSDTVNWNGRAGFVPIGTSSSPFTGTIDGQNHKIANLFIKMPSTWYVGLFGVNSNSISNVGLVNANITGNFAVGGLVGENRGSITNSYTTGSVGGIGNYEGGLAGANIGAITNSYSTASVGGHQIVGGLVGWNKSDLHKGFITNSYAAGSVNGGQASGGLVGRMDGGAISLSFATGSVNGYWYVGGLVGEYNNSGTITNCYATGSIVGRGGGVAGLIGYLGSNGMITNSYATGHVIGPSYVGGLVGMRAYLNTVNSSYWDTATSGQPTSNGGTGKTTAEMKQQKTFDGWDFGNIWAINEGASYPYFSYILVISAHADVTDEATSPEGAVVDYVLPTATDIYGANVIVTCTPASGSTFALGDTTVTCNAEDAAGHNATPTSFIVHVVDTTPPVVTVPADITKEATGPSGAVVTFSAFATDIVDGTITPTCTPASGLTFALGNTTVTCNAVDVAGNHATQKSFIVHVVDTTPPAINVSAPECVTYGKGNGNKANKITVTAQDNCSKSVIPRITKVEVFNNGGNPVTGNGIYEISGNTVYVTPNGSGWSVRITAIAADENGNPQTIQITKSLIRC